MAEIQGIVTKTVGERCEVKVDRVASENKSLPRYLDCWNPINAKVGDTVGAEFRSMSKSKANAIIYGCPIFGFIAGALFGYAQSKFFNLEGWKIWAAIAVGAALFEFVSISYVRIFKRDAVREGVQPVTYEIQVEELTIDLGKK